MIADMLTHAKTLLAEHGPVACAGVSIGGPLMPDEGLILSPPNLPGWDRIPLATLLQRGLGIPVHVEHDGAACAVAEYLWGGHGRVPRMAYVTCGTGFGAGILIDGRPLRGLGRHAAGNRPSCATRTTAPQPSASAARWRPLPPPRPWAPSPPGGSPALARRRPLRSRSCKRRRRATPTPATVMRINAQAVAHACTILAEVFGVEMIVLGSSARYFGPAWVEAGAELVPGRAARALASLLPHRSRRAGRHAARPVAAGRRGIEKPEVEKKETATLHRFGDYYAISCPAGISRLPRHGLRRCRGTVRQPGQGPVQAHATRSPT